MNKLRRKEIYEIIRRLYALCTYLKENKEIDLISMLSDIIEDIDFIFSDEECYKDNIPENLQGGYRYEAAEEACDNLESAKDSLEDIDEDDSIEDIMNSIEEAIDYLNEASC